MTLRCGLPVRPAWSPRFGVTIGGLSRAGHPNEPLPQRLTHRRSGEPVLIRGQCSQDRKFLASESGPIDAWKVRRPIAETGEIAVSRAIRPSKNAKRLSQIIKQTRRKRSQCILLLCPVSGVGCASRKGDNGDEQDSLGNRRSCRERSSHSKRR